MKPLAIGLIFSILFSSLPAKVWACGLNLCPMDHHEKGQNDEQLMPCHQQSSEQGKDQQEKAIQAERLASQATCPCPDTYIDVAYIPESRNLFEISKLKLHQSSSFNIAKLKTESDPILRYRPPPPRSLVRLQVILQVFLI